MKAGDEAMFRVEVARASDLPEVRALAATGGDAQRWPDEAWGGFLVQHGSAGRAAVLLLGRNRAGKVCGWLAGSVITGCAELEFVWVCPPQRGCGLGRLLLGRWFAWVAGQGAEQMFLEVRASNERAIALYRSLGFIEGGRRRAYYREPVEDAIVMRAGLAQGG